MSRMSNLAKIVCTAALAALATPVIAQEATPLDALKGVLNGFGNRAATAANPARSPAQAMAALRGKWQAALEDCYQPSDAVVYAESNSWSGYEWSCEVPADAYNSRGFSGDLACAAEGEEYRVKLQVVLAPDGKSLTAIRPKEGTSEKLVKCPKETEAISF